MTDEYSNDSVRCGAGRTHQSGDRYDPTGEHNIRIEDGIPEPATLNFDNIAADMYEGDSVVMPDMAAVEALTEAIRRAGYGYGAHGKRVWKREPRTPRIEPGIDGERTEVIERAIGKAKQPYKSHWKVTITDILRAIPAREKDKLHINQSWIGRHMGNSPRWQRRQIYDGGLRTWIYWCE